MPQISVIVPVYKAEAFLHSCVDSILSQTFSDFEIILVDDGSPDGSGAICDEYAAREPRISVIHQKNQGQAAARNHALTQAKGTWICFVDSDDLIHPQMLQMLYDGISDQEHAISMCPMLEAPELPERFFQSQEFRRNILPINEKTLVSLHDADAYPSWVACAKLIPKETILKRPFREGRVYEDNEAVCHWVCDANTLVQIPHPMYFYRTNPESTTKSTFSLKKLDYLWALESMIRFYGSIGYRDMRKRFVDRYAEAVVSCCNGVRYTLQQPERVRSIERSVRKFLKEENIQLTKAQFEAMLDAMHPKLVRIYWPAEALVRTLRQGGFSGIVKKINKHIRKGENE